MMTYDDFYKIAEYGNENWKGCFTPREIANNAYDYLCEYQASKIKGKPTRTMIELCKLICEDMDYADYAEIQEESEYEPSVLRWEEDDVTLVYASGYTKEEMNRNYAIEDCAYYKILEVE